MNILFYTPLNGRCRDIESQAIEFAKAGHKIFLLTQSADGLLHQSFRNYGYYAVGNQKEIRFKHLNHIRRIWLLATFIYRNKIDIVYSHLEPANFISVLAQVFISAKVVICRHHINEAKLYGFDKDLSYKITYAFAKNIVVVSKKAKVYMISEEKVKKERIHHINLAYNFDLYNQPNLQQVSAIREKYHCQVLLLTVCRLTKFKRPDLSIKLLSALKQRNLDVKLIILGNGEMMGELMARIKTLELDSLVFLPGYVSNVLDFMKAADYLVHPSLLDSSSISLKEAGLVELPVIVCKGVGDFDEVVRHNKNGYLVDQNNFVEDSVAIITSNMVELGVRDRMGKNLKATVLKEFDIRAIAPIYEQKFHF